MDTVRTTEADPAVKQGGEKTAEKPAPVEPKAGGMVNEGEDTSARPDQGGDGDGEALRGETF